jgi:dGTPase
VNRKRATSTLIGRFCAAAESATRQQFGEGPLRRYDADLVVPDRERAECALLKAITAVYVMGRPEAADLQARERTVVTDLVDLLREQPQHLDPMHRDLWREAPDDSARLRVVVDEVAGFTDAAAWRTHQLLGR